MGVEVTGSTLGIIGMGEIWSGDDEQAVGASNSESLDDLLRRLDFVVIAVKQTSDTTGLIGRRELSTGTLLNISRGIVVDKDALVKALRSGTIGAAALDVTHPEPLPRDHPLLGRPNVLITPHIGISTHNAARRIIEKMIENAPAAVKGSPVPNEVKLQ